MELQEISDRLEIQDLLARYTYAVDTQDWDVLDRTFTDDAHIDYSGTGGITASSLKEAKDWLAETLPGPFASLMHNLGQMVIDLDGNRASVKAALDNPMRMHDAKGGTKIVEIGAIYHLELTRTADGWRVADLRQELKWDRGFQ